MHIILCILFYAYYSIHSKLIYNFETRWHQRTDQPTDRPTDIVIYRAAIVTKKSGFGSPLDQTSMFVHSGNHGEWPKTFCKTRWLSEECFPILYMFLTFLDRNSKDDQFCSYFSAKIINIWAAFQLCWFYIKCINEGTNWHPKYYYLSIRSWFLATQVWETNFHSLCSYFMFFSKSGKIFVNSCKILFRLYCHLTLRI